MRDRKEERRHERRQERKEERRHGHTNVPSSPPPLPPHPPASPPTPPGVPGTARETFLTCLAAQVGKTYVHATAGPNTFDCSGLVDFCYRKATGETIPGGRGSELQCQQAGAPLGKIAPDQMRSGDLLCYLGGQHVGVYEGDNVMINALNENEGVRRNDITTEYWRRNFDGARRLF